MDSRSNYIAMFCTYQNTSQSKYQALNNNHSVQKGEKKREFTEIIGANFIQRIKRCGTIGDFRQR